MSNHSQYRNLICLALAWFSALFSSGARADAEPQSSRLSDFLMQDYLFGDWGGLRTDLSKRGVDFEFFYAGSFPDNLDGGLRRGGLYQGALLMMLDLDSKKLLGYDGGHFHVSSLWLNGEKPFSDRYIGDLNKVNLIDFPNSFRLWELWYQQQLLEKKLTLKFGQLAIDRDFIVPEYYNSLASVTLLNQTFFYPTLAFDVYDIAGLPIRHHGLASTPYATPGALVRWDPVPEFYAQAAVYGGNPDQSAAGTTFNLSEKEGALSYFELGYRRNRGTNQPGLEGSFKLGAFYHTSDFVDIDDAVTAVSLRSAGFPAPHIANHKGDYGAYLLAEQQLFRELDKSDPAKQGLVAFFRAAAAPGDRNLTELGLDAGLVYKGLIPGRDWDTLALGGSYLEMSDEIRDAQRRINALAPGSFTVSDYEGVIELSYKLQMSAWWTLQPSLQHVFHPGGSDAIPNATVFILMTTLRF